MSPKMHEVLRGLHVALGFGGFTLGVAASLLPKFGGAALRHRWVGRGYATCMLAMASLSVPLALRAGDYFLLTIGLMTLSWVAGEWIALGLWRRARLDGRNGTNLLLAHITLMGSSYIGAWTAFLVNVRPLGSNPVLFWCYALGPTMIGTLLIRCASGRCAEREKNSVG